VFWYLNIFYQKSKFLINQYIFSRIVVSISACHSNKRRRPGFNSQLESSATAHHFGVFGLLVGGVEGVEGEVGARGHITSAKVQQR
jgi:hypothetical protein